MKIIPIHKKNYMSVFKENNTVNWMVIEVDGETKCFYKCDPGDGFFETKNFPCEYDESTHKIVDL